MHIKIHKCYFEINSLIQSHFENRFFHSYIFTFSLKKNHRSLQSVFDCFHSFYSGVTEEPPEDELASVMHFLLTKLTSGF